MTAHICYGDYSARKIKKVVCQRCRKLIKDYTLQLLLSQDEALCPTCAPSTPSGTQDAVIE